MPDLALDFSATHPDVADLLAEGVKAILFYSRTSTPPRAYLDAVVAAGIGACPIFETAATRSFGGYGAGASDGDSAAGDLTRIGVPDGVRLFVNMADTPNVSGHEDAVAEYARGFVSEFPARWRLGAYGPLAALRAAQAGSPRFDALWAVETWGAPSGNPSQHFAWWSGQPDVVLVQMANVPPPIPGTDTNWIVGDLGAWGGEDDMAISDEQMNTLGKWMQDQREVMLNVLIGDHNTATDKGVLAGWENDTRKAVTDAVKSVPAVAGEAVDAQAVADAVVKALAARLAR